MSGALGGVFSGIGRITSVASGVGSGVGALSRLIHGGGAGPAAGQVQIGEVTLDQHEVPDTIPWGTTMGIVEHRFPGGDVFFALTGPQRKDITWSARMLGANAAVRAKALDQFCADGVPATLTWGTMSFNVIVSSFSADYKRENWTGSYTIACKVFPDYAPAGSGKTGAATAKGGLAGALSSISSGLSAAVKTVGSVVGEAQAAVGGVSAILSPVASALGISLPGIGHLTLGLAEAQSAVGGVSQLAAGTAQLANVTALLTGATVAAQSGVSSTGSLLSLYGSATDLASTAGLAGLHASYAQTGQVLGGTQADLASQDLTAQAPVTLGGASTAAATRTAPAYQATAAAPATSAPAQSFAQAVGDFTTSADQTGGASTVNVVTPSETPIHITGHSPTVLSGGTYTAQVQGLPGSPSGAAVSSRTASISFINGALAETGTGF